MLGNINDLAGMMVDQTSLPPASTSISYGYRFVSRLLQFSTYGLEKQWRMADGSRPWAPASALGDQEEGPGSQLLSVQL